MSSLARRRSQAREFFASRPRPGRKDENWRFLNLTELSKQDFAPASPDAGVPSNWDSRLVHSGSGDRVVMVNGGYAEALSSVGSGGIRLTDTAVDERFGTVLSDADNAFAHENTTKFSHGLVIETGKDIEAEIHLVWLHIPEAHPSAVYPRLYVEVGEGSRLRLVEEFIATANAPSFTNAVAEVHIKDNGECSHLRLAHEAAGTWHFGAQAVNAMGDARYHGTSVVFDGRLTRVDIHADLAGAGAETSINGLFALNDSQVADHHIYVRHRKAHTSSSQVFKGVLAGSSRGVFNGRITIDEDAQATSAEQTNDNLLLSERALVQTNPQLLIFADDVQCRHGATVGQLSEEQVFYLVSRGIPRKDAKKMLTEAFVGELLDTLWYPDTAGEVRTQVMKRVYGDV